MSLQHFFLNEQILKPEIEFSNNSGFLLSLNDEDFHHAKVLRLKAGEHIGVIDANNIYYECEIISFDSKLKVKNCVKRDCKNSNKHLWLCPGLSKGNKLDDIVRAATEIGVYGFIPVVFERSIVKLDEKKEDNKIKRMKKIIKSAAMQSGQFRIPSFQNFVSIRKLCNTLNDFDVVFICWEEADDMSKINQACDKIKICNEDMNIAVVVGPEGGITKEEVLALQNCNKNSYVVSIGDSVLRTETAAVVASAIIKFNLSC